MKNDGKDAEAFFEGYWSRVGHCERLRDKKDLVGLNRGAPVADFAKPSDFLVSSPTVPLHFAEVKSTFDERRFAFGKIQRGQSAAALKSATRGDGGYVFYIFSYPLGEWFVMSCKKYKELVDAGQRSAKFEELAKWLK